MNNFLLDTGEVVNVNYFPKGVSTSEFTTYSDAVKSIVEKNAEVSLWSRLYTTANQVVYSSKCNSAERRLDAKMTMLGFNRYPQILTVCGHIFTLYTRCLPPEMCQTNSFILAEDLGCVEATYEQFVSCAEDLEDVKCVLHSNICSVTESYTPREVYEHVRSHVVNETDLHNVFFSGHAPVPVELPNVFSEKGWQMRADIFAADDSVSSHSTRVEKLDAFSMQGRQTRTDTFADSDSGGSYSLRVEKLRQFRDCEDNYSDSLFGKLEYYNREHSMRRLAAQMLWEDYQKYEKSLNIAGHTFDLYTFSKMPYSDTVLCELVEDIGNDCIQLVLDEELYATAEDVATEMYERFTDLHADEDWLLQHYFAWDGCSNVTGIMTEQCGLNVDGYNALKLARCLGYGMYSIYNRYKHNILNQRHYFAATDSGQVAFEAGCIGGYEAVRLSIVEPYMIEYPELFECCGVKFHLFTRWEQSSDAEYYVPYSNYYLISESGDYFDSDDAGGMYLEGETVEEAYNDLCTQRFTDSELYNYFIEMRL